MKNLISLCVIALIPSVSNAQKPNTTYIPLSNGGVRVVYNDGCKNYSWDVNERVTSSTIPNLIESTKVRSTNRPLLDRLFPHRNKQQAQYTTVRTTAQTVQAHSSSSVATVPYQVRTPTHAPNAVQYGITNGCASGNCPLPRK